MMKLYITKQLLLHTFINSRILPNNLRQHPIKKRSNKVVALNGYQNRSALHVNQYNAK